MSDSLRERLDHAQRGRDAGSLAERLLAIGRDCAAHLREPYRSADHGELLYDERGLRRDPRTLPARHRTGIGRIGYGRLAALALPWKRPERLRCRPISIVTVAVIPARSGGSP